MSTELSPSQVSVGEMLILKCNVMLDRSQIWRPLAVHGEGWQLLLLRKPVRPSACSSVSTHRKGNGDVILEVPASFRHAVVLQYEGKVLW